MYCKSCGCEIRLWEIILNVLVPGSLYPLAYHLDCWGYFSTVRERQKRVRGIGVRPFSLSLFEHK